MLAASQQHFPEHIYIFRYSVKREDVWFSFIDLRQMKLRGDHLLPHARSENFEWLTICLV